MEEWTLELRIVVALIYSLIFGGIVAVCTWFYARRRGMTKAEREAEDVEIKNECNF
jgi:type VI protein secretion system component VasK